jgi:hypothetical protein
MQHRDDALAVMPVGRRDVDRQREAVFINREMDPLIFLPPSKPRPKQVGAERHDRLSMMTALGSGVSPQASRQARTKRLSRRRHRPRRVQRANSEYSVPNGMSHSWPMARHCTPQKQTHQIAMMALRSAARDMWSAYDGKQQGDPDKLGATLVRITRMENPPKIFAAGSDAVQAITPAVEERLKSLRDNASLSGSTDGVA